MKNQSTEVTIDNIIQIVQIHIFTTQKKKKKKKAISYLLNLSTQKLVQLISDCSNTCIYNLSITNNKKIASVQGVNRGWGGERSCGQNYWYKLRVKCFGKRKKKKSSHSPCPSDSWIRRWRRYRRLIKFHLVRSECFFQSTLQLQISSSSFFWGVVVSKRSNVG